MRAGPDADALFSRWQGVRSYAEEQKLVFRQKDGSWVDATVMASIDDNGEHTLSIADRRQQVMLHAWNHAPRELPSSRTEAAATSAANSAA